MYYMILFFSQDWDCNSNMVVSANPWPLSNNKKSYLMIWICFSSCWLFWTTFSFVIIFSSFVPMLYNILEHWSMYRLKILVRRIIFTRAVIWLIKCSGGKWMGTGTFRGHLRSRPRINCFWVSLYVEWRHSSQVSTKYTSEEEIGTNLHLVVVLPSHFCGGGRLCHYDPNDNDFSAISLSLIDISIRLDCVGLGGNCLQ